MGNAAGRQGCFTNGSYGFCLLSRERPCKLLSDGQKLLFGRLNVEEWEGCRPLAFHGVGHRLQPDMIRL